MVSILYELLYFVRTLRCTWTIPYFYTWNYSSVLQRLTKTIECVCSADFKNRRNSLYRVQVQKQWFAQRAIVVFIMQDVNQAVTTWRHIPHFGTASSTQGFGINSTVLTKSKSFRRHSDRFYMLFPFACIIMAHTKYTLEIRPAFSPNVNIEANLRKEKKN